MSVIDSPHQIPSVDRLLNEASVAALTDDYGAPLVTRCVRNVLEAVRQQVLAGKTFEHRDLIDNLREDLSRTLTSVITPGHQPDRYGSAHQLGAGRFA